MIIACFRNIVQPRTAKEHVIIKNHIHVDGRRSHSMNRFSSVSNIILLSTLFIYLDISAAEMIVSWYPENGYNFLPLPDHKILSVGDKWIESSNRGRIIENACQKYLSKFEPDWVETEEGIDSGRKVRLKPLNGFRSLFESPGNFLLM